MVTFDIWDVTRGAKEFGTLFYLGAWPSNSGWNSKHAKSESDKTTHIISFKYRRVPRLNLRSSFNGVGPKHTTAMETPHPSTQP